MLMGWEYRGSISSLQCLVPVFVILGPSVVSSIRVLHSRVLESIISRDFPSAPVRLRKSMSNIIELYINCDHSCICSLVFVYLPGEPSGIRPAATHLRYLAMSDHHIESIAIRHCPLILIADRRIMDSSLFGYFEAKKTGAFTSIEIFDHTNSELVPRLLVDSRLGESLSSLTITDTDPFGMCGVDDELAFDLEISRHTGFGLWRYCTLFSVNIYTSLFPFQLAGST